MPTTFSLSDVELVHLSRSAACRVAWMSLDLSCAEYHYILIQCFLILPSPPLKNQLHNLLHWCFLLAQWMCARQNTGCVIVFMLVIISLSETIHYFITFIPPFWHNLVTFFSLMQHNKKHNNRMSPRHPRSIHGHRPPRPSCYGSLHRKT